MVIIIPTDHYIDFFFKAYLNSVGIEDSQDEHPPDIKPWLQHLTRNISNDGNAKADLIRLCHLSIREGNRKKIREPAYLHPRDQEARSELLGMVASVSLLLNNLQMLTRVVSVKDTILPRSAYKEIGRAIQQRGFAAMKETYVL